MDKCTFTASAAKSSLRTFMVVAGGGHDNHAGLK